MPARWFNANHIGPRATAAERPIPRGPCNDSGCCDSSRGALGRAAHSNAARETSTGHIAISDATPSRRQGSLGWGPVSARPTPRSARIPAISSRSRQAPPTTRSPCGRSPAGSRSGITRQSRPWCQRVGGGRLVRRFNRQLTERCDPKDGARAEQADRAGRPCRRPQRIQCCESHQRHGGVEVGSVAKDAGQRNEVHPDHSDHQRNEPLLLALRQENGQRKTGRPLNGTDHAQSSRHPLATGSLGHHPTG